jgi:hypothetical protein
MALCREMHERIDLMRVKEARNELIVANVAVDQGNIIIKPGQIGLVAGIGQGVEDNEGHARNCRRAPSHEIGTDKPRATGYEHLTGHEVLPYR